MQSVTQDTLDQLAVTLAETREKVEAMTAIVEQMPTTDSTAYLHRQLKTMLRFIWASQAYMKAVV